MSTERIDRVDGWIDTRRRPLINLRVRDDRLVCTLVDTGFNGYLLWESRPDDLLDFPGELSTLYESVEVAGGTILANLAVAHIKWFGPGDAYAAVETLVGISARERGGGDPAALLGTALLSGLILVADFLNATLHIERST